MSNIPFTSEGLRQRVNATEAHTNIAIVYPNETVVDTYISNQNSGSNPDHYAIPAGQTSNYWYAVFSKVKVNPGLGKRKVMFLDRKPPGNWTILL
jgi:hypothetical protein